MEQQKNPVAQKLLESFRQFHRLNWQQIPKEGLKSSEIMVLFSIKKRAQPESPGIKVSDISSALQVAPPSITPLINGLESNGYIERTMDKADRRAVRVKLTEKGEGAIEKASKVIFDAYNGLVEYLGEEKSNELAELLTQTFRYFSELGKDNN